MESYYLSKHPIKVCRDYMRHSNIYDLYIYTWEEKENYFLITFEGDSYGMYWELRKNVKIPETGN